MKLHFLKTQWSDMILLEENGKFALVDTGFLEQYEQLSAYLLKLGVKEIEFILLTHFHRDHYGNIEQLVKNFTVNKVYFKEYGGHDVNTAWGTPADDDYRQSERIKWAQMRDCITNYSELEMVEKIVFIDFEGCKMRLYNQSNSVQAIFEDETHPETYQKNICSENQNSLGVFFETDGKTVFLGGDIMDAPSSHPLANFVNLQIAKQINKQIYLYKAPHHGTNHTASEEALAIYRPKIAVFTNSMEWLSKFDAIDNIKKANPDAIIMNTDEGDIVVDLQKEQAGLFNYRACCLY